MPISERLLQPTVDFVTGVLFTEGSALTLPVERCILLSTTGMTTQDIIQLPSHDDGVEPGMLMTITRVDIAPVFPVVLAPAPGDKMCGTVTAANVALWRIAGGFESVTLRATDGGAGVIDWIPEVSGSRMSIPIQVNGIVASGTQVFHFLLPWGCGSVKTIAGYLTAAQTGGTLTIETDGLTHGDSSGTIPATVFTPGGVAGQVYAPYVGNIGDGTQGDILTVAVLTDAGYVGPAVIFVNIELW